MPIDYKKLYETHDIILTNANPQELVTDGTLESVDYMRDYFKEKKRFIPPVDFASASNFARFGSAEKYYIDSIDRILETYPYDGSLRERVQWELSSSYFDLYLFNELYPRTNGHITLSADGWSTQNDASDHYGEPTTKEYIFIKGGPNTSNRSKEKDITDTSGDYKSGYANLWNSDKNRECNLKIGGIQGNTIEFWMKKDEFVTSKTGREVIFDAYTHSHVSSSEDYGRLTLEMTGTTSTCPFTLTYMSGATGFGSLTFDDSAITTGSIADGQWHHYAFTLQNAGSDVEIKFYFDGACSDTRIIADSSVGYVSGGINATIGSLATQPSGTTAPSLGWGKLSGSIDEFRFWKTSRNSLEILRYMIEPVGGGTNTDDANTDLGVYFKFNEGITGVDSYDRNILDYSGRISNGFFVGYNTAARDTTSAMVHSGFVDKEFKDPILYSFHPDVAELKDTKSQEGKIYDYSNNSSIYHTFPSWITEEDEDKNYAPLKNLTQILGSYFDSVAQKISAITKFKYKNYLSASHKPFVYGDRLLQSIGFDYFPELFSDATALEHFKNRNDRELYEQKLYDTKNRIYQNIFNNIVYINKSKGTEKSFRNLIHCFGLGDEIYRINTYGNRVKFKLKDNFSSTAEYKKYVNFSLTGNSEASVYPYYDSDNSNSKAIISSSYGLTSYLGFTMESEVHFPIRHTLADSNTVTSTHKGPSRQFRTYVPYNTASLFGIHQVELDATDNDLTWAADDYANFQVLAIKPKDFTKKVKFLLTGTSDSVIGPLALSSDYIHDVYDDTRWTFSVSIKPNSTADLAPGSSGSLNTEGYLVEFYGIEKIIDVTKNEFYVTGTISADDGLKFLNYPKAPFIGAHRVNFTGSLREKADGNISSTRVWYSHLPTGTIQQHHIDVKNYGAEHPHRSSYLYPTSLEGIKIPQIDTLVLNWTFDDVTGSDSSGEFVGSDFSSGSVSLVDRYGAFGEIVGKQYLPKGFNFPANSTIPINKKFVFSAKKNLPEIINSADMVQVLQDDDKFFNKVDLMRPTNYYTSIEKSMYQTISDEMIRMFATIKDFNNLIGEPVNKYRQEYKDMAKLRQMFYERVGNTPDLDKYIDFYKWVDITLDSLLGYLVPLSSDISDRYGGNIRTVVENTVLHRNKYKWQYPTLEDKTPDPEGVVVSNGTAFGYNWKFGHPPLPSSPLDQAENCLWWKERAERTQADISSGDSNVDSNKQTMLNSIVNETNAAAPTLGSYDVDTGTVTTYEGSTYARRRLARPLKLKVDQQHTYKNALNSYENKNVGFFNAINRAQLHNAGFQNDYSFYPGFDTTNPSDALQTKNPTDVINYSDSGSDGEGFTINTWIKLDTNPKDLSYPTYILHSYPKYLYTQRLGSTPYLGFKMANHDTPSTNYVLPLLEMSPENGIDSVTDSWINVCVTYDGRGGTTAHDGIKWFINGTEHSTSLNLPGGTYDHMPTGSYINTFGAEGYSSGKFEGYIDDFSVWSGSLSASSIQEIYNNGLPLDISSLTPIVSSSNGDGTIPIWYRFGDGDEDIISGAGKDIKNLGTQAADTNTELTSAWPSDANPVLPDGMFASPNYAGYSRKYGTIFVASSDIDEFKDCDDYLDLNAKRKYSFKAKSKPFKVPSVSFQNSHEYKGDKILPFNLYSSSVAIDGGTNDSISNNFKDKLDITNLHLDVYGPDYEVPMQTPFTEKFVGGSVNRHVFSNFSVDKEALDSMSSRPEKWYLEFGDSELRLFSSDFRKNNLPRAHLFRDEYAKRPVNIKNIKMFTGSDHAVPGRPEQVLNSTNMGNYTHDHDLIMTSGRRENNRYFVKSEGALPTAYTDSAALSGVVDFALPRRDLTGSNNFIIVNRFSSPGDPVTMCEGMLDVVAGEYSVYNSLPWRNLTVRQPLNELYSDHCEQFGYFSDWYTQQAYELADETYPGWNSEVNSSDYSGTGSFHKINRNPIRVKKYSSATSTSSFTDDEVYDNWFVQHQIPQTDLQYAWITASIVNDYSGPALYGFEQPDYSNASLASTDITFCSASAHGSYYHESATRREFGGTIEELLSDMDQFIPVDFAGLNTIIQEPISKPSGSTSLNTNLLGNTTDRDPETGEETTSRGFFEQGSVGPYASERYINPTFLQYVRTGQALLHGTEAGLNAIILHRQGPYGWPSWKQIRGAQHPVMRYNYKNNIQTFVNTVTSKESNGFKGSYATVLSQSEPPLTSKFLPLRYNLVVKNAPDNTEKFSFQTFKTTYGNQKSYFTNIPDKNVSGLIDLNNSPFVTSPAGNTHEGLQSSDNTILAYNSMNKYLLKNLGLFIPGPANPIEEFVSLEIPEVIYPREHYTYKEIVRERQNYSNGFWRDSRAVRDTALGTVRSNSQGIDTVSSSMWPLDGRSDTSVSPLTASAGIEGELQNGYSLFSGSLTNPLPAATYNRRIPEQVSAGVIAYAGDTAWEAGDQTGYNPSYNTYQDFIEEPKRPGKDYGIIPEYRISEHIKYYEVDADKKYFSSDNASWLSLTGAAHENSSVQNFYTVYAHSDFMKHFSKIRKDFKAMAPPSELHLQCSAITKFIPYDGFYPAQRTLQIAQLFSQSFGASWDSDGEDANWRTILAPLFSPGIMYNSIKSGLAVDYPIVGDAIGMSITGSSANGTSDDGDARLKGIFDNRIPFEALLDPDKYVAEFVNIHDSEPNQYAHIDSTGSLGGASDDRYKLAVNNFMAEVPRFFLGSGQPDEDPRSTLTRFESLYTSEGTTNNVDEEEVGNMQTLFFEADKTYKTRIVCSHSEMRSLWSIKQNNKYSSNSASFEYNNPTIMMYNRSFDASNTDQYSVVKVGENGETFSYGSSFGPPVDASSSMDGIESSFEPFTPPYYNGYSHLELTYKTGIGGPKTISDVLSEIEVTSHRECIRSGTLHDGSSAGVNAMSLSASINWNQVETTKNGLSRWVIQPKWECPVLDFTNSPITLPSTGTGSIAKGMWHQKGEFPAPFDGVFLEIKDIPHLEAQEMNPVPLGLAHKLGFDNDVNQWPVTWGSTKKVGVIPEEGGLLREAIVAVPFFNDIKNKGTDKEETAQQFIEIPRDTINWAIAKNSKENFSDLEYMTENNFSLEKDEHIRLKPAESILNMTTAMNRYSLPPRFRFLENKNQTPFAMVFFEFEMNLTQQDLMDMWQGIMPNEPRKNATSGIQHAEAVVNFSVDLTSKNEVFWDEEATQTEKLINYKGWDLFQNNPGDGPDPPWPHSFPEGLQWMVFKVKQKAAKNYDSLVAGKPLDVWGNKEKDFSYNWPYDFCSIIELAKIDSTIVLKPWPQTDALFNPEAFSVEGAFEKEFDPATNYDGVGPNVEIAEMMEKFEKEKKAAAEKSAKVKKGDAVKAGTHGIPKTSGYNFVDPKVASLSSEFLTGEFNIPGGIAPPTGMPLTLRGSQFQPMIRFNQLGLDAAISNGTTKFDTLAGMKTANKKGKNGKPW